MVKARAQNRHGLGVAAEFLQAFTLPAQDLHDDVAVRGDAAADGQGAAVVAAGLVDGALVPADVAHELQGQGFFTGQHQLVGLFVGGHQHRLRAASKSRCSRRVLPWAMAHRQRLTRAPTSFEKARGRLQLDQGAAEQPLLVIGDADVQAVAAHVLDHAQLGVQIKGPAEPADRPREVGRPEGDDAQQIGRAGAFELPVQDLEHGIGRFGVLTGPVGIAQAGIGQTPQVQELRDDRRQIRRWASMKLVASSTTCT